MWFFLWALHCVVIFMSCILCGSLYELYTVWFFLWALHCVVHFMSCILCGSLYKLYTVWLFWWAVYFVVLCISFTLCGSFVSSTLSGSFYELYTLWFFLWALCPIPNSRKEPNTNDDMLPFRLWHLYSLERTIQGGNSGETIDLKKQIKDFCD